MIVRYTTAKFANYAHIHAYVIFETFSRRIKERHLQNADYWLNVTVDQNVVTWSLNTANEMVIRIFRNTMDNPTLDPEAIKRAVQKLERRNNLRAEMKDALLLAQELNKIHPTEVKLQPTDDSLQSPAIDFFAL